MTDSQLLGNRYQLLGTLGHGGMAEVYEGQDVRLGRKVAIKVLRPDLARDPSFQARFRREAQAAASLNHPNIVAVYDTGEDLMNTGSETVQLPYMVMEFVDGMTLRQLLTSGRRLLPERALEITSGILSALDYSHRHGIVHRDIKPGNVMLTRNGEVKVMDFGIARAMADAQATMTSASAVMGTAQYLSPEQAQGQVVDARSDLYSTGVVLYELLTGRPPFAGDSPVSIAYQHVQETPVPPSAVDPGVPSAVDPVVLRALAKNPAERYQTAAEFRDDVQRAIAGIPVSAVAPVVAPTAAMVADSGRTTVLTPPPPQPPMEPTDSTKKRSGWTWFAVGAAVLALLGVAFLLGQGLLERSDGAKVKVPTLTGSTLSAAEASLARAGLKTGQVLPTTSDQPKDTVLSQNPGAGTEVASGSTVDLTISAGKEQTVVPNLVGMTSPDKARTALRDANLALGAVDEQDSDQPEGSVLSQTPQAGTKVDSGSTVNITVSNGKVKVPDVVNKTEAQAKSDLINAGFQVNVVQQPDPSPVGTVLAQSPQGGTTAARGSQVTITVSSGSPTPTPTPTGTATGQPSLGAEPRWTETAGAG